jgi:thiol-disulfide isomerase/thioredoxin
MRAVRSTAVVPLAVLLGFAAPAMHASAPPGASSQPSRASTASLSSAGAVSTVAPSFSLDDVDGKTVRLSDYSGKVVVLEFWATWCGPCTAALPVLTDIARDKGRDVVVLAINVDDSETAAKVRTFLAGKKISVRALLKGKAVSRSFGVGPIPHTVIIGRDGRIAGRHVGFTSEAGFREKVLKDVSAALAARK